LSKDFSKVVFMRPKKRGFFAALSRIVLIIFVLAVFIFGAVGIYFLKGDTKYSDSLAVKVKSIELQNRFLANSIELLRPNIPRADTSFKAYRRLLHTSARDSVYLSSIDSLNMYGLVDFSNKLLDFFADIAKDASSPQGLWRNTPLVFPFADNTKFVIIRPFSQSSTCPFTGMDKAHLGIDLAAEKGTPILAPADGVVLSTNERDAFWGRIIRISHANGYETRYAHLNSILVRAGQRVSRGTQIGTVGESGWATAPHLHFELIRNGVHLDPMLYNFNYIDN